MISVHIPTRRCAGPVRAQGESRSRMVAWLAVREARRGGAEPASRRASATHVAGQDQDIVGLKQRRALA
jgi:hypothetical protein